MAGCARPELRSTSQVKFSRRLHRNAGHGAGVLLILAGLLSGCSGDSRGHSGTGNVGSVTSPFSSISTDQLDKVEVCKEVPQSVVSDATGMSIVDHGEFNVGSTLQACRWFSGASGAVRPPPGRMPEVYVVDVELWGVPIEKALSGGHAFDQIAGLDSEEVGGFSSRAVLLSGEPVDADGYPNYSAAKLAVDLGQVTLGVQVEGSATVDQLEKKATALAHALTR